MSAPDPIVTSSHVAWPQAFTPAEMDAVVGLGEALAPRRAEIPDPVQREQLERIRITRMAWLTPDDGNKWFYERMGQLIRSINERFFQFELTGFSDPFQYTIYSQSDGGHYEWHVDQGATRVPRKLSLTLQLSEPSDYEGCDLELRGGYKVETAPRGRGTLIAFPAYVLHRVTPIKSGTRRSLVAWVSGPKFR